MSFDNVAEILRYIAHTDDKCATDVTYALALLSTNIDKMRENLKYQMIGQLSDNRFDELERLTGFLNNITALYNKIESCINILAEDTAASKRDDANIGEVDDAEALHDAEAESRPESGTFGGDSGERTDYSQYEVDRFERHDLSEDFVHSRIAKFEFKGKSYPADSWKTALMTLVRVLYEEDPDRMKSFVDDERFIGKKIRYFTLEPLYAESGCLRTTKLNGTDLFVHTNLSSNDTARFIRKILEAYGYSPREFIVFLRADYKELHYGKRG